MLHENMSKTSNMKGQPGHPISLNTKVADQLLYKGSFGVKNPGQFGLAKFGKCLREKSGLGSCEGLIWFDIFGPMLHMATHGITANLSLLADVPFLSSGPLGGSFRIGIPLEIENRDIEA